MYIYIFLFYCFKYEGYNVLFTVHIFGRFVLIGRNATYPTDQTKLRSKLMQQASFPENPQPPIISSLPVIKDTSINIYEQYVNRAKVYK